MSCFYTVLIPIDLAVLPANYAQGIYVNPPIQRILSFIKTVQLFPPAVLSNTLCTVGLVDYSNPTDIHYIDCRVVSQQNYLIQYICFHLLAVECCDHPLTALCQPMTFLYQPPKPSPFSTYWSSLQTFFCCRNLCRLNVFSPRVAPLCIFSCTILVHQALADSPQRVRYQGASNTR
jgi:hypothetical protein